MMSIRLHEGLLLLLAVLVALAAIFWDLGSYPLIQPDEGRNAEVAREMLDTGAWRVPLYNGMAYLDKPAFYFRTVATAFTLFGESETSARLSSALFASALLAMVYAFCRREYDRRTAALALLVTASAPLFLAFARIVIFDMTLAFFVCAAIFSSYLAEADGGGQRRKWYAIAAACGAVATLVKGPVGFLLPILVMVAFNLLDRRKGWAKFAFAPRNILIFLAIVLPWFIGVSLQRPDFPYYGLVKESLERFTSDEFRRSGPLYYYLPVLFAGLFGWSAMLPELAVDAWRRRAEWSRADRLFIVWAVTVVLFFSVSQSKLPGYVLTAVVALSVLLARALSVAWGGTGDSYPRPMVRRATLFWAILCVVLGSGLLYAVFDPGGTAQFVRGDEAELVPYLPTLAAAGGSLLVVAATAWLAWMLRDPRWSLASFVAFPLLFVSLVFSRGMNVYAEEHSSRALMERMPELSDHVEAACYLCFPNSLPCYLKSHVTLISDEAGGELQSNYIRFTLEQSPEWPDTVVSNGDLDPWLASRKAPVFMIARRKHGAILREIAAPFGTSPDPLGGNYWGVLLDPPRSKR